jgi:hypothetical protein
MNTTSAPAAQSGARRAAGQLRQARATCPPGCFGYHATWPLSRRAGIKSHPGWHRDFLRASVTDHPQAAHRPLDIVITGAADDAMLTVLADLVLPHPPRLHLVDRCATPLIRCAATAARRGLALTTEQRDLAPPAGTATPWAPDASADLVLTDGLLSLLPSRAAVEQFLTALRLVLRPDGQFCYTTRLTAQPGDRLEHDLPGRTLQAVSTLAFLPARAQQRRDAARRTFSRPARPAPFASTGELRDTLAAGGLTVTHLERDTTAPSLPLALHPRRLTGRASTIVRLRAEPAGQT